MSRAWKVGDVAWFVEENVAFRAPVYKLDPKRKLVGVVDWTEPNNIAWYDAGNVFTNREAAVAQLRAWLLTSREEAIAEEHAKIAAFCLDLAGQEDQRANRARKKGHVDNAVIARCKADAFRQLARDLAPPKPKKARKVTK